MGGGSATLLWQATSEVLCAVMGSTLYEEYGEIREGLQVDNENNKWFGWQAVEGKVEATRHVQGEEEVMKGGT